jgi:proteasome lid subunit RPN8/RPN11
LCHQQVKVAERKTSASTTTYATRTQIQRQTVPTIVIPESIRDELLSHAREETPEEACGILAGTRTEGEPTDDPTHHVETHHPAENVAETPRTRYEIDPREQLELMEAIEESGREVVGFYHSHPRGPAGPSATDAAQATWPSRSYLIVSLEADGEATLGSWRWTGEAFVPESVVSER